MVNIAQVVKVRGINYVQLWSNTLELTADNGEISIELSKDNMEEIYKKLADKLGKQVEEV
ncbi:hypothetical protein GWN49_00480 [Candidatus Bathyarchaeota archaeon]|nr:hypothetical protein [Candidatus Bathyarchaeota archaeon]